jgi:broad-specificity NMP kinase
MTRRIAITGIDGTGKTTLIRALARRWESRPGFARAFRAPQFHESPGTPYAELSADIDALSVLADRRRDLALKASSLFLSMTLYGDVERRLMERSRPRFLFGERQPLLDSLVYALFYAKLLQAPLDRDSLAGACEWEIGAEGIARLSSWMKVLGRRDPELTGGLESFWNLPLYAKKMFELPVPELLHRLSALYAVDGPEEIVVLEASGSCLEQRLAEKRGTGTERELHETKEVLEQLQKGLRSALVPLRQAYPRLRVHEIDTSGLSIAESCERIVRAVGASPELTGSLPA